MKLGNIVICGLAGGVGFDFWLAGGGDFPDAPPKPAPPTQMRPQSPRPPPQKRKDGRRQREMIAYWEILEKNEWREGEGTTEEFWHEFKTTVIDLAIIRLENGRKFIYDRGNWFETTPPLTSSTP